MRARAGVEPWLAFWLLVLYVKARAENIPAHILRQIKEEIEHG